MIIGIPANIIVLFVSIYNFHKSQSETILLINLALADLLQLRNEFSKCNILLRLGRELSVTSELQASIYWKLQKALI